MKLPWANLIWTIFRLIETCGTPCWIPIRLRGEKKSPFHKPLEDLTGWTLRYYAIWHTLDTEESSHNSSWATIATKFGAKWNRWWNLCAGSAHKESTYEITYIFQPHLRGQMGKDWIFYQLFVRKHFYCVFQLLHRGFGGCGLGGKAWFWLTDTKQL